MSKKKDKRCIYVVKDMTFNEIAFITEYKVDITQFFKYRSRRERYNFVKVTDNKMIDEIMDIADHYSDCDYIGDEIMTSSEGEYYLISIPDLFDSLNRDLIPILRLVKLLKIDEEELDIIMEMVNVMRNRLDDFWNSDDDNVVDDTLLARRFLRDVSVIDDDEMDMTEEEHKRLMKEFNIPY